jgi:hypothetical protein
MLVCKELARYAKQKGDDFRSLGRWCSTLLYADKNHRFCIVSTYNMGRQAPLGDSTIFQQQLDTFRITNYPPHLEGYS